MYYSEPELIIEILSYQPETPATAFDPGEDEEFTFTAHLLGYELHLNCQTEALKDAIHDYALEQARQEYAEHQLSRMANIKGIEL